MQIGATISGCSCWNSAHARSSDWRTMKPGMVVTGSGSPVTSWNADMNRRVSTGIRGEKRCHPARMSGV